LSVSASCSEKKPLPSRGSCDGSDFLLFNWKGGNLSRGDPCHHYSAWSPLSTNPALRYRGEVFYPQEEPLNFCLSSLAGGAAGHKSPTALRPENPLPYWDPARAQLGLSRKQQAAGGYLLGNLQRKYPTPNQGKHGMGSDLMCRQEGIRAYEGLPSHTERYTEEVEVRGGSLGSGMDGFGGLVLPESSIKTENDSDSESPAGRHLYAGAWEKHHYLSSSSSSSSMYPDHHHQVKTEADFYDHFNTCQKAKGCNGDSGISPPSPPHNSISGHHKYLYTTAVSRLSSTCSLYANKSLALFSTQRATPQAFPVLGPAGGGGGGGGGGDYPGRNGYGEAELKGYGSRVRREDELEYPEFQGSVGGGAVQAIKREPLDSPPWSDCQREDMSHLPVFGLNSVGNKAHQYIYMQ